MKPRNFVHKHMQTFNHATVERDRTKYNRSNDWREEYAEDLEFLEKHEDASISDKAYTSFFNKEGTMEIVYNSLFDKVESILKREGNAISHINLSEDDANELYGEYLSRDLIKNADSNWFSVLHYEVSFHSSEYLSNEND